MNGKLPFLPTLVGLELMAFSVRRSLNEIHKCVWYRLCAALTQGGFVHFSFQNTLERLLSKALEGPTGVCVYSDQDSTEMAPIKYLCFQKILILAIPVAPTSSFLGSKHEKDFISTH